MTELRERLLAVCHTFSERAPEGAVLPEPYIPYFPSEDPRVLVLAEAQNLSDTDTGGNESYRAWLARHEPEDRMHRLDLRGNPDEVDIEPWDNGMLKVGVKAALPHIDIGKVAVSNAIPWSWVTATGANARPFKAAVRNLAAELWRAIFEVWEPDHIIASGEVAQDVMKRAGWPQEKTTKLVLPSPRWDGAAGMFDPADLLVRYPEAKEVIESDLVRASIANVEEKKQEAVRRRLVFYACHAVS